MHDARLVMQVIHWAEQLFEVEAGEALSKPLRLNFIFFLFTGRLNQAEKVALLDQLEHDEVYLDRPVLFLNDLTLRVIVNKTDDVRVFKRF